MSCENVQELISPLLDRRIRAEERESVMAHLESCRNCSAQFESTQKVREALGAMSRPPVPEALASKLRVMASHEVQRRRSRATLSSRWENWAGHARLWFDNLMRPV